MNRKPPLQNQASSPRPKRRAMKRGTPGSEMHPAAGATEFRPQDALAAYRDDASMLRLLAKAFLEATDSCVIVDKDGQVVALNNETERAYGWTSAELKGQAIQTIMPPEWRGLCSDRMKGCLKGEVVRNVESERWNKAGERIPVLSTYSLLRDEKGRPTAIAVLTKDITELRRVEVDLKRSQQELRDLSSRLLTATEEEGKKIARELHDSFGPRLARLNLRVSGVEGLLSSQPDLAAELRQISQEIGETAKAAHDLSRLLHPAALSQLGIEAALEAECATFSKFRGIAVDFSAENVPMALPDSVAFCFFRVAQEALQNIRKHAQTKSASVRLAGAGHDVVMWIQDLGRGFDASSARGRGGVGLVSMEERVRIAKGTLVMRSSPGKGTQIEVRIPVSSTARL